MFPYQAKFRRDLGHLVDSILEHLGVAGPSRVSIVGARAPGISWLGARQAVCVDTEDEERMQDPLRNLLESVESIVRNHPLHHEPCDTLLTARDKPEVIRRNSVTEAVSAALASSDRSNAVRSFCGLSFRVGTYYIVPVIQLPERVFQDVPQLNLRSTDSGVPAGPQSFLHAALDEVLTEASVELQRPEPGRAGYSRRGTEEIVRRAASAFMTSLMYSIEGRFVTDQLFERLNLISSLMYEGSHGVGQMILAPADSEDVKFVIRFSEPIPFREPRWVRKALEMASKDVALISDCQNIHGLGRIMPTESGPKGTFIIDFVDHYTWRLRMGEQVMLVARYGVATLPKEPISRERFVSNLERFFSGTSARALENIWQVFCSAIRAAHGSLIIIAADAKQEAQRLASQGTIVEPLLLTPEVFERVSGIDGAVLVDVEGWCHAVGVILDGIASPECTPSRGSRFNSGVGYVMHSAEPRVAIVVSDDRTVDVIPLLRPRISSRDIEANLRRLEQANLNNFHSPREWLERHQFYLNKQQCMRANTVTDRIEAELQRAGQLIFKALPFHVDIDMNDDYLID
jgi:hypothetical protein